MTTSTANKVGLIGLGAMGSGMAASLRRAGYDVHVFDVRQEVADKFAKDGGHACKSVAELVRHVTWWSVWSSMQRRLRPCCSDQTATQQGAPPPCKRVACL